jgi:holliday junction DNA helicase RuvA
MIGFLRGQYATKTPARVVIDVNGVGYEVNISLHTYSAIANAEGGQLFTYLHITENAQSLFGFADMVEKELFLNLISVSGVGASTARMMLSGMHPEEIVKAIVQGNTKQLEGIKGIGKKSAERLIVELRDKLAKGSETTILPGFTAPAANMDAINALISLGIGKALAEQGVKKAISALSSSATVEEIIKYALKNL